MKKYDYYLAGPMRGYDDHNYPEFYKIAKILRDKGFTVFSPAEANPIELKRTYEECMQIDLDAVVNKCNGVVCMPGWKESQGANTEVLVAFTCGKTLFEIELIDNNDLLLKRFDGSPNLLPYSS